MKFKAFIEALGNDKEFLKKFLGEIEGKIKEFKGISIEKSKIEEPIEKEIEINNQKSKVWSSFIEIDGKADGIESLIDFVLWYSPSKIEIEDVKEIKISTDEGDIKISREKFNNLLNQISFRIIDLSRTIGDLLIANRILQETIKNIKKDKKS
ncbi:hypothetical protein BA065_01090 [Nanoarchaeota archaeon NZ13-N]|uniref:Uncharacterized protein n=1 Tax=Candidatus Nanoclepta minutus TaxID=1940235 RepID=A0A397WN36_9ARCH|nr:MAG: hypothetical protein BA065_01090 [Nanoarchaeota archaeon NZ13-N]RIB35311.1 MAG: hypothetical protein BXU00_02155 [Candidatus Nanoclepta minutus]